MATPKKTAAKKTTPRTRRQAVVPDLVTEPSAAETVVSDEASASPDITVSVVRLGIARQPMTLPAGTTAVELLMAMGIQPSEAVVMEDNRVMGPDDEFTGGVVTVQQDLTTSLQLAATVLVNNRRATAETVLSDGDVVTVAPQVKGGNR